MVDITAGQGTAGKNGFPSLGEIGDDAQAAAISRCAVGVLTILVVLILPLPPILLDLFAAPSRSSLSILILMTSLFIQAPLEFSSLSDRAADRDRC